MMKKLLLMLVVLPIYAMEGENPHTNILKANLEIEKHKLELEERKVQVQELMALSEVLYKLQLNSSYRKKCEEKISLLVDRIAMPNQEEKFKLIERLQAEHEQLLAKLPF